MGFGHYRQTKKQNKIVLKFEIMAQEKNLAFKFLKEVQQTLEWTERVIGANFHFDKHKFISFLEDGTSLCSLAIYIDERFFVFRFRF